MGNRMNLLHNVWKSLVNRDKMALSWEDFNKDKKAIEIAIVDV